MPLFTTFSSRRKSRLSTKTKFWPHLRGCISVEFVAALSGSPNCFKDIHHGASHKNNRTYSKQLAINSTLSHLHIFLFGSMVQLFTEVMQETVYNLCGETNAHDSLNGSKYCKLCSTLWILQINF